MYIYTFVITLADFFLKELNSTKYSYKFKSINHAKKVIVKYDGTFLTT